MALRKKPPNLPLPLISVLVVSLLARSIAANSADSQEYTLSLKHIFHSSAGPSQHQPIFRRLDVPLSAARSSSPLGKPLTIKVSRTHREVSRLVSAHAEDVERRIAAARAYFGQKGVWNQNDVDLDEWVAPRGASANEIPSWLTPSVQVDVAAAHNKPRVRSRGGKIEAEVVKRSILVPDPTDPDLVLNVGAMTFNTYYDPSKKEKSWIDYGYWNESTGFGWESDGIRGYVFADPSNEIMVITVKGTSPSFIGIGDGPTAPRDKYNDNMMFSCCCAKAGWSWTPVCDCSTANKKCDSTCLARESSYADSYYNMAQTIYVAVSAVYSYASIWMAGHSLGGSLASLVALTNGVPAMTFEAPGDLLYASRIGLLPDMPSNGEEEKQPDPRGRYGGGDENEPDDGGRNRRKHGYVDYSEFLRGLPIWAYGNNEDPIFLGICTGPGSTCWFGGYAMESRCHVGKTCTYNDKEYDKNRGRTKSAGSVPTTPPDHDREVDVAADMGKHGIDYVIKHYLAVWKYVPDCIFEEGCRDCEDWEFYDSESSGR